MIKLFGLIGGFCFAYCGVPQAFRSIKFKNSYGTPRDVAWMIFLGGIFMFSYLAATYGWDWLLFVNYFVETVSWGIILFYCYRRS